MFAPQLELVPVESRLEVLEVTGAAQSPAGVLTATMVLVMLTVPPPPFEMPPLVLLATVALKRFVVEPPEALIPTWLLEIVVFRIVVVAVPVESMPVAFVFPEICEFSTVRSPEFLSAAAPALVPTDARFRIVTPVTPGAMTKMSGVPVATAMFAPVICAPGADEGPAIVRLFSVTLSGFVGANPVPASWIVSPAAGHALGG